MKLDAAERRGDLYPDRHLNVFVPFHGHLLDANVTRAVVSTFILILLSNLLITVIAFG